MKRHLWLVLLPVLLLSLWFNWRALRPSTVGAPADNAPPPAPPSAAPPGPVLPEAVDFTGTGFDDQAWQLDPATPAGIIPDQIPAPGLPAAPAPPAEWDPDVNLSPGAASGIR